MNRPRELVIVVMPVFDEMPALPATLGAWLGTSFPEGDLRVLVIDDGSTDGTAHFLDDAQRHEPRLLVEHQINAGHGAAILAGYRRAIAAGAAWILQVDGDGQFDAADATRLWAAREGADLVLGHRPPGEKRLNSRINRWLVARLFGFRGPDLNVGFRLMRAPALMELLPHLTTATPNTAMVLLAHRWALTLRWIPVRLIPPSHPSHLRGLRLWRTSVRAFADLLRLRWRVVAMLADRGPRRDHADDGRDERWPLRSGQFPH